MRNLIVGLVCVALVGCGMAEAPKSQTVDAPRSEVFKAMVGNPELDAGLKKVSDSGTTQLWERTFSESESRQLGLKDEIFSGPVFVQIRAEPSRRMTMTMKAVDSRPSFKFIYTLEDGPTPNSTVASVALEADAARTPEEERLHQKMERDAGKMLQKALSRLRTS